MPMRADVLRDRTIGRKKTLRLTRGFEPLHPPLPLPCGLVRVLCTIIEIPMLAMFDSRQNLSLSRSVALQFVGHDHARDVG